MSRQQTQPQQSPSFLVRDVLPDIAELLRRALRKTVVAEQVADLRIYGRCPCGAPACGTFYCVPPEEHGKLVRHHGSDGSLDPVTVSNGRIITVQTLDPQVDAVLDRLFPATPGVATRRIRIWLPDLLFRFERHPPATEAEVERAERATGIEFPLAYREFLLMANGGEGQIGSNSYASLWKAEELFPFNRDYEVEKYAPGLLLFGSNGGGDGFAFDCRSDLHVVSVPFIGMSLDETIPMATTFDGFLEHLGRQ